MMRYLLEGCKLDQLKHLTMFGKGAGLFALPRPFEIGSGSASRQYHQLSIEARALHHLSHLEKFVQFHCITTDSGRKGLIEWRLKKEHERAERWRDGVIKTAREGEGKKDGEGSREKAQDCIKES